MAAKSKSKEEVPVLKEFEVSVEARSRLTLIGLVDQSWREDVEMFVLLNPEFVPFLHVAPGSNGRGHHGLYDSKPNDVKEFLKYYAMQAGVNRRYGHKMWDEYVSKGQYDKLTEKKRLIMQGVDALPPITTADELRKVKVKGVGVGGINAALNKFFGVDVVAYSDRAFGVVYEHMTGDKNTPSRVKKWVEGWQGRKEVGEAFMFAIYHRHMGLP